MRRVRRWPVVACLAAFAPVAAPFLGAAPAAAAGSSAVCVHRWQDTLTPGATTTPQVTAFTSHGETGVIACSGTVAGRRITGPGTFGEEGSMVGSCSSGTGRAVLSITLPTAAGPVHLRVPVTFGFVPGVGGTRSDVFPGDFVVRPVRGDCLTTPVTEIEVTRAGVLRS